MFCQNFNTFSCLVVDLRSLRARYARLGGVLPLRRHHKEKRAAKPKLKTLQKNKLLPIFSQVAAKKLEHALLAR